MTRTNPTQTKFINKLVMDCVTFRFTRQEGLQYIKEESGIEMSEHTYDSKRSRLQRKRTTNTWLNYFTRIGFVEQHKKMMDDALKVQDDRMKQFAIQTRKNPRNEMTISRINADINMNIRLITDLMDSTPIVASIKARILQQEREGKEAIKSQDVPKTPPGIVPVRSTTNNPDAWTIP